MPETMEQTDTTDAELLAEFAVTRGDAPFAQLVGRHGAMVMGVCRRVLMPHQEADDVVQAVFLTLAHKAHELRHCRSLGGWLHYVARNVSMHARRAELVRRKHQFESAVRQDPTARGEVGEALGILDEELLALPNSLRQPIVLHHLEGRTLEESAVALRCKPSAVSMRLTRGMERLRRRMMARGIKTASVLAVFAAARESSAAIASEAIANNAVLIAAGQSMGAAATKHVAMLTQKGVSLLYVAKLKAAAVLLAAAMALISGSALILGVLMIPDHGHAQESVHDLFNDSDENIRKILNMKIDVVFRRDTLGAVLENLGHQADLKSTYPKPLGGSMQISWEKRQVTVKDVVMRLVQEGGLEIDCKGDTIVFWKHADDSVIESLGKKLKDGQPDARYIAVYELGQLADKRVIPYLFTGLHDSDVSVAELAASRLLANGQDFWFCYDLSPEVDALLKQDHELGRSEKIQDADIALLGYSRDPRTVEFLIHCSQEIDSRSHYPRGIFGLVQSPDLRAAARVAELKGELKNNCVLWHPALLDQLMDYVKNGTGEESSIRSIAGETLAYSRDPRGLEFLMSLSGNQDVGLRILAARSLKRAAPDGPGRQALIELLRDDEVEVRKEAAQNLADVGDPHAIEPLIELANDPNMHDQARIFAALSRFRDSRTVEYLIQCARSSDPGMSFSLEHLGRTRDSRAVDQLVELLKDTKYKFRYRAAAALGWTMDPRAAEALLEAAKDTDFWIRSCAIKALGCMPAEANVIPWLLALAQDPIGQTRRAAAEALTWSKSPLAKDPLIGLWRTDPDIEVRRTAAVCLKGLPGAGHIQVELLAWCEQDKQDRIREQEARQMKNDLLQNPQPAEEAAAPGSGNDF
jgi:RNA polymerase sigma factor (sigma-70 family)